MPETTHIAFLRAVNVGGTGKLKMDELKKMCAELGYRNARTYIASGNLAFEANKTSETVQAELEETLEAYAGKPVGVIMRTSEEVEAISKANPFPDAPGNRVMVLMLNRDVSDSDIDDVRHQTVEEIRAAGREIFIFYPEGQGQSKLALKTAQAAGTARNMNTVSKMKQLARNV